MDQEVSLPLAIPYTPQSFSDSLLPILIGIYVTFVLFGISLLQFYHCYRLLERSSSKERGSYAFLTLFLALNFADQITKGQYFADTQRGVAVHGQAFRELPTPSSVIGFITLSVAVPFGILFHLLTHLFYAQRIYQLCKEWKFRYVIWAIIIFSLLASCMTVVFAGLTTTIAIRPAYEYFPAIKKFLTPWLIGEAAVDVLLSLSFIIYFTMEWVDFHHAQDRLTRWIDLIIGTGLLSAALALVDVYLAIWWPGKTCQLSVNMVVTKLYINSALVLFNNVLQARVKENAVMALQSHSGSTMRGSRGRFIHNLSVSSAGGGHTHQRCRTTSTSTSASAALISSDIVLAMSSPKVDIPPVPARVEVKRRNGVTGIDWMRENSFKSFSDLR